jgi:hypothetical protein
MKQYTQMLVERLDRKGIEINLIPGFVRSLANAVFSNPDLNVRLVNERLRFLGWEGFDLDYYTLELATLSFEAEGLQGPGGKSGYWFETRFSPSRGVPGGALAASDN